MPTTEEPGGQYFGGVGETLSPQLSMGHRRRSPWAYILGTAGAVGLAFAAFYMGGVIRLSRSCFAPDQVMSVIAQQEARGQWELAAANARGALTEAHLCAEFKAPLAQMATINGIEAVFAKAQLVEPGDLKSQSALVDELRDVRALATEHHVTTVGAVSPWSLARRAYQAEAFLLGRTVLVEALTAHHETITERADQRLYHDLTRNVGFWKSHSPDPAARKEGLELLALAAALAKHHDLHTDEAILDLTALVGADRASWPQPAPDPILPVTIRLQSDAVTEGR